jgi:hypothetical protein
VVTQRPFCVALEGRSPVTGERPLRRVARRLRPAGTGHWQSMPILRALDWLTRADSAPMAQSDAIGQNSTRAARRQSALQSAPHHCAIVAAWTAACAATNAL